MKMNKTSGSSPMSPVLLPMLSEARRYAAAAKKEWYARLRSVVKAEPEAE